MVNYADRAEAAAATAEAAAATAEAMVSAAADTEAAATSLATLTGEDRTIVPVPVAQGAAGATELAAAVGGRTFYLHKLVGALDADGTLTIEDTDGSDLTGAVPLLAKTPVDFDFGADKRLCPTGGAGKGLQILTGTGKFAGIAYLSYE